MWSLLLLYLFLALGVSFLCSIMEAVLLSITPSYVASLEQQDDGGLGRTVRALKEDVDRPLAAILSLNTIAHTIGAAGVGAQVQLLYSQEVVTIASVILTLLILILSEIIPKTLGATYWRELTGPVVKLLKPLIWIVYPLVVLSQGITRLLSRDTPEQSVSREEFRALTEQGHREGILDESESQIVRNLLRFSSVTVESIMTPRTVMFALPETKTVGEVTEEHTELPFSRIPVYQTNSDDCNGYVLRRDVLHSSALDKHDVTLSELKRELLVVPESISVQRLFERLLAEKEHIALVIDEYGGTAGVVTMEDVVETLIGLEIVDEVDTVQDMQELARQQWKRRAERLGLIPPGSSEQDAQKDAEKKSAVKLGLTGEKPPSM